MKTKLKINDFIELDSGKISCHALASDSVTVKILGVQGKVFVTYIEFIDRDAYFARIGEDLKMQNIDEDFNISKIEERPDGKIVIHSEQLNTLKKAVKFTNKTLFY